MTINWTEEKPTEQGWYWIDDLSAPGLPIEIVKVEINGNEIIYIKDHGAFLVDQENYKWSSRIPEPE